MNVKIEGHPNLQEINIYLGELMPLLLKLINDNNFKVSITSLNILHRIVHLPGVNQRETLDNMMQILIEKLGDSKIAVRQATSKIILEHFHQTRKAQWIEFLIKYLTDRSAQIKEEIVTLLRTIYIDEDYIPFNYEKVLNEVAPLMEDVKTKIKIKALDCLVAVTVKNNREQCKGFLAKKLNQV